MHLRQRKPKTYTLSLETVKALEQHSKRTKISMSKIIDAAVLEYLLRRCDQCPLCGCSKDK